MGASSAYRHGQPAVGNRDIDDELELLKRLGREDVLPDEASMTRARTLLERRIEGDGDGRRRPWRPFHLRWALVVALALLIGSLFGFALGSTNTSSSNAASAPVGLGFLPERGWSVLQTAKRATLSQEAIAIAANVRISPDDAADRLPYSTLLSLPPSGVVMLASFTARGDKWRDPHYALARLPLRLRDAVPGSIQVRPERPLGQYQLHAGVNGHNVDVTVYFGTPRPTAAVIRTAQRQLDRLVVRSPRRAERVEERAFPIRRAATGVVTPARNTSLIVDRTFVCTLSTPLGTFRDLDLIASPLYVDRFRNFTTPAFIGSSSGRVLAGPVSDRANLVFVRARATDWRGRTLAPGVYVNTQMCTARNGAVALSPRGLPGPPVEFQTDAECALRGRVLVRVRAALQTSAAWRTFPEEYAGAQANVRDAKLAVRSERTRKPIALMELRPAGKTRFWAVSGCA
jgi:hypothetical protein